MNVAAILRGAVLAATLILGTQFGLAAEVRAEADFSGKTIVWTVPNSPGGGSGTIAQFLAPLLTKYLPGHPEVTISYVPGGGSIKGANLFAARAKPDGLNLLITTGSTQLPYLLGDPRVQYDYKDWQILMAMPTGGVVYVSPSLGVTSAKDIAKLLGQNLLYANQGATSLDLVPLLAFKLLGLNVQHIFGYRSRADGRLAFERGDVNIDYQTTPAYLSNVVPLVEAGKAVPLFSWGVLDENGDLVRDPTFPNLPDFGEVYKAIKGTEPSGPDYEAYLAIFTAEFPAQKMVFVPKNTPKDIVTAYREAFAAMKDDPEFQANIAGALGKYSLATGKAADALFRKGTTISRDSQKIITEMLATEYGVRLGE